MKKTLCMSFTLAMVLAILFLPGCSNDPNGYSESPSTDAGLPVSDPVPEGRDEGTEEVFEFEELSLKISNVKEIKRGSVFDGMTDWEYDIYVVYPGAVAEVVRADMFINEENGLSYADWAFLVSDGTRIDIVDDMEPLEITENLLGVFDPESSLYVLEFEMCY